nr:hypothetical protein [Anaerolineae bacterium]
TSTAVRVYGLAAAAIVLVLGLFLVIGGDGRSMAGAAIGTDDFGKLALVVGVVMMMLVWVFYRDKK